jgi:hypothetical protein
MFGLGDLLARQNADGGWPYRAGGSWTEPTVYALLALAASGQQDSSAVQLATKWLARNQRPDGGWAPSPSVDQTTWVTALVLVLPDAILSVFDGPRALDWLVGMTGKESSWLERARSFLIDGRNTKDRTPAGWPWFPDTAAWVIPTSFGLLALEKANRRVSSQKLQERCKVGRQFLLSRRCADGGWNHGSTRALGYDSSSYPETTGLALLSLNGVESGAMANTLQTARRHLSAAGSLEADCWLRMGLRAHGEALPVAPPTAGHGGISENALAIIADQAAAGRNMFLE